ncbi:sulfotransferase [Colwellia sp. 1_MG-2023]|uniref:tetratricopeptide repeat-containing sulfotransferase family protein n=1 Tax=unclassified Colwellia TaxID=196834 RepID=UPI001C0838F4|nr:MULTISPECIES: tetratricopeptide repeat-containing sulfotransferase family protein [unclassified Colwellia]MBU2924342.1 sulfotransferase [Colwellia sp. C2M11]MDO6650856.1 sulfotransferase [Colwellia sp. 3_MG-2023]MDO6663891.1 sulfotransferase [Colwellia sp. 2_MG-2023]MDO6688242.1 sulfotransferase [Colwellia sp. 1_MG-2023]
MDTTSPQSFETQLKSIQQLIQTAKFNDAILASKKLQTKTTEKAQQVELWYLIAVAQRYAKNYAQALTSINTLLKLDDHHSRANQEKGFINLALGESKSAMSSFEHAVKLNPSLVASWQELIELYRDAGQQDNVQKTANQLEKLKKLPPALLAVTELMHEGKLLKAEQICRHFLQNNKRHIDGMCLLAEIGMELKVYDDAEFLLASALELEPTHLYARSQYLNLLIRLGKYKAAEQQVETLLNAQPNNITFKVAKANVLTGLGKIEEAIVLFEQAISQSISQGNNIAGFHLQLGHALKAKGEIKQAVLAYQKAYQINPSYGDAFWSLANTKTYRFSDDEIAQMQAQQDKKNLPIVDEIQLSFATGKAFEDRAQYQQAFQYYQQGNKLQNEINGFDISKIEQQVEEQIKYCTAELFEKRGHLGLASPDPIFIVGLPRAGSTLLEQILASHSQVDGTMELHNILGLASRLRGRNSNVDTNKENQYPKNLHEINPDYFKRFGQQFIDETRVYREQAPLFIDKMPNNFLHIGLIRLILPNAKIIDARRSPMACCFSGFKQLFAEGQDFSYKLEDIGRYYQAYLKLMNHWHEVLPDFVLTVHHEDVVDDLDKQVHRILDFCGLPFEQSCIDFHKTKRNIKTPSSEQVRQPIYKSATEQWKHFEQYLDPLKKVLNIEHSKE